MKILLFTYEIYNSGGNFIRSYSIARELVRLGHDVTLISGRGDVGIFHRTRIVDGVIIIESPDLFPRIVRNDGLSPIELFWRVWHVITNSYDLVHGFGHRPTVSLPSFVHTLIYRKSYIADWCDLWGDGGIANERVGFLGKILKFFDTLTEPLVYKHATAITVISHDLERRARKLGFSNTHIFILPAGSAIDVIKSQQKQQCRKFLDISINGAIVVYAGFTRYDEQFLADVFIALANRNSRVKLLLMGGDFPLFWKAIQSANLINRVIYKGIVQHERISPYLASGDVMLLPYSNREINRARFPNKLGDYLASGRPIITNPTGDMAHIFKKYTIGFLVQESPTEFAKKIQSLLIRPKLQQQMGKNARKLAECVFAWSVLTLSLEGFYTKQTANCHR